MLPEDIEHAQLPLIIGRLSYSRTVIKPPYPSLRARVQGTSSLFGDFESTDPQSPHSDSFIRFVVSLNSRDGNSRTLGFRTTMTADSVKAIRRFNVYKTCQQQ